ncbi:hypothetical protein TI05_05290 [Achromatium sp. WMS3]|nr:hypothetical protein TI05_05290 [Achromatium sp. WMS3]
MKNIIYTIVLAIILMLPTYTLAAGMPSNPGQQFLKALDADGNGSVSQKEFIKPQLQRIKAQLQKRFQYMDKNRDNRVTAAEADAFAKEMQQHFQKMRHQRR